jgi:hypothetical protein
VTKAATPATRKLATTTLAASPVTKPSPARTPATTRVAAARATKPAAPTTAAPTRSAATKSAQPAELTAAASPADSDDDDASLADDIVAINRALGSKDLASARKQMQALSASQERSPELQRLAEQVARLERQRDAALQRARSCETSKASTCVVRYANRALAIDARNAQAHSLVRRASVHPKPTAVVTAMSPDAEANAPLIAALVADQRHSGPDERNTTRQGIADTQSAQADSPGLAVYGWGAPAASKGRGEAH